MVVFGDDPAKGEQLWLFGGFLGDSYGNDVWLSSDGVNWDKKVLTGNIFPARSGHQVVVFDDGSDQGKQLWLIGGAGVGYMNDVWSSKDGNTWQQRTAVADFSARYGHQVVVFDDNTGEGERLWLIGGADKDEGGEKSDVWRSKNGTAWQLGLKKPLEFVLH